MSSNITLTSLDFLPALGALALCQQFSKRKMNSGFVFNFVFLPLLITFSVFCIYYVFLVSCVLLRLVLSSTPDNGEGNEQLP